MWLSFCNFVDKYIFIMKQKITTFLSTVFGICFILVLVLTFIFSSSAFGRVLTKEEVANFILNAYGKWNTVTDTDISNVEDLMAHWQTVADNTSSHEGYYSMGYSNRLKQFFFVYYTGGTTQLNTEGNTAWMYSSSGGRNFIGKYAYTGNGSLTYNITKYNISTNTYNEISQTNGSDNGNTEFGVSSGSTLWLYTDKKLGASTGGGLSAHGQVPTSQDLFAENYITSEVWNFQSSWSNTVNLSGDSSVDYYVVDPSYVYTVLGYLQDSSLCTGAAYDIMAYNKSNSTWETVYDWGEYFTDSDPISNYFSTGDINGVPTSTIKIRSNLVIPDTIINFYFAKGNSISDLDNQINVHFYVRGSNSVINNGIVDYDTTFSNPDYYNDYQYEVDGLVDSSFEDSLSDVNQNLNNGSNVPEIVGNYFGSSGEVAEKLGYIDYSGDNPYGNVYLTVLEGVRQVLIGSGHVVLTCTVHGQTFTFDSDDFQNPSPAIKVFTTSLCIFLMVYTFWGLAFMWTHKLAEGDILGLKSMVQSTASSWASIIKRF